jgi:hypothetical protein
MVNRTNDEFVGDTSPAIAATTAGPATNDASEKRGEHRLDLQGLQAAVEAEPDDARAIEMVSDALMSDPLGFFFEIWDAENAADAQAADERLYEGLFGKLKRDRAHTKRRPPSWPYEWQPYCLVQQKDGTWIMLGREYKKLGNVQSSAAGWCDWDAPDHVVWEFDCGDPRELLNEGIFCEASPNNHPNSTRLYLPFDARDYGKRIARLVRATVDPPRYTRLLLAHCGFDPPPPPPDALAA